MTTLPSTMMIFAAGLGKRLQPLTLTTPKPLAEVGGITLLEYNIHYFAAHGVKHFIINSHYLPQQIECKVKSLASIYTDLEFSYIYEPELLETGGGVLNALHYFAEQNPLFIANSDGILVDKLQTSAVQLLTQAWNPASMDMLILGYPREDLINISMPGDFTVDCSGLVRFAKADPLITSPPYIYAGVMFMKPELFKQKEISKFSLLEFMVQPEIKVKAAVYEGDWLHISDVASYEAAEKYISGGKN